MRKPSNARAKATRRALQSTIESLVKYGHRPRNRAERRAERVVDYGDYLKALVGEIHEVTGQPMQA